ncbi:hypothetical protein KGA66_12345 [Actinocrinis puniceicyclus]|uniref:Uncharacterized protein n=1 Tax=Actinocrinis puniceicyclus TaxID=977794 RepID=A0A8J7WK95_9ACTN|nr:hypothetical protein [Actinocrinis puniceicyclus]MBS2963841.1 hypothetical protein [Actinocrinis puniceicyclus]
MVRELPEAPVRNRVAEWCGRLMQAAGCVPLRQLYRGDHWTHALSLPGIAAASGFDADLWVASAGLGLQPVGKSAPSYAATFSPRHPDCVGQNSEERALWWAALQASAGAATLADLARRGPVLLAMSEAYAAPLGDELAEMARQGGDTVVIGGSAGLSATVRLPADAGLRSTLGGTRTSLNVRMAAAWLHNCRDGQLASASNLDAWQSWVSNASRVERYDRAPISDDEVREFIAKELAAAPSTSRTRLLRTLRDSGRACEQTRFSRLFSQVAAL